MSVKYSEDHEWVDADGNGVATIGITDHAQEQLGELVYVELPEIGRTVAKGDEVAVVESVKAASEVYSPVSGEVVEVNETLADSPTTVNDKAESDGWLFKLKLSDTGQLDGLMDADAYKTFCEENG